jgi:hypothetical protein
MNVRPIADVTSIAPRNRKMAVLCKLFGTNSLKEGAMWHVDLLIGNDGEISNYIMAVIRQRLVNSNRRRSFFGAVRAELL